MITHTHKGVTWGFVEIQEGVFKTEVYKNKLISSVDAIICGVKGFSQREQKLPEGQWSIVGKASEIGEEVWEQMVEYYTDECEGQIMHWSEFKNYEDEKGEWFCIATESGYSLLKSHSLNPDNCLILKMK